MSVIVNHSQFSKIVKSEGLTPAKTEGVFDSVLPFLDLAGKEAAWISDPWNYGVREDIFAKHSGK